MIEALERDSVYLKQLIPVPKGCSDSDRSPRQDGPDVMVGSDLNALLNINGALKRDPKPSPRTSLA
jgi:hypothetical protein